MIKNWKVAIFRQNVIMDGRCQRREWMLTLQENKSEIKVGLNKIKMDITGDY